MGRCFYLTIAAAGLALMLGFSAAPALAEPSSTTTPVLTGDGGNSNIDPSDLPNTVQNRTTGNTGTGGNPGGSTTGSGPGGTNFNDPNRTNQNSADNPTNRQCGGRRITSP